MEIKKRGRFQKPVATNIKYVKFSLHSINARKKPKIKNIKTIIRIIVKLSNEDPREAFENHT